MRRMHPGGEADVRVVHHQVRHRPELVFGQHAGSGSPVPDVGRQVAGHVVEELARGRDVHHAHGLGDLAGAFESAGVVHPIGHPNQGLLQRLVGEVVAPADLARHSVRTADDDEITPVRPGHDAQGTVLLGVVGVVPVLAHHRGVGGLVARPGGLAVRPNLRLVDVDAVAAAVDVDRRTEAPEQLPVALVDLPVEPPAERTGAALENGAPLGQRILIGRNSRLHAVMPCLHDDRPRSAEEGVVDGVWDGCGGHG